MKSDTTYAWRVKAYNDGYGSSDWSVSTFTVNHLPHRRIIVGGTSFSHDSTVRAAVIEQYPELDTNLVYQYYPSGFQSAIHYAYAVDAEAVVYSYVGLTSDITEAQKYYPAIQSFVPLGSNSYIQLSQPDSIPVIVTCGAGKADTNQTGYGNGLEFFDYDVNPASSFSNSRIAGKMLKIKDSTSGTWWDARYRARQTASKGGVWDIHNGYGKINVDAAINYGGSIPSDPYKQ